MDNSKCDNAKKITGKPRKKHMNRASHSLYSPKLSASDFRFFGTVRQKIEDLEFRSVQDIVRSFSDAWSDLTLEDIQSVLLKWLDRLTRIIEADGEYFLHGSLKNDAHEERFVCSRCHEGQSRKHNARRRNPDCLHNKSVQERRGYVDGQIYTTTANSEIVERSEGSNVWRFCSGNCFLQCFVIKVGRD
jgi:hypothetical protein